MSHARILSPRLGLAVTAAAWGWSLLVRRQMDSLDFFGAAALGLVAWAVGFVIIYLVAFYSDWPEASPTTIIPNQDNGLDMPGADGAGNGLAVPGLEPEEDNLMWPSASLAIPVRDAHMARVLRKMETARAAGNLGRISARRLHTLAIIDRFDPHGRPSYEEIVLWLTRNDLVTAVGNNQYEPTARWPIAPYPADPAFLRQPPSTSGGGGGAVVEAVEGYLETVV